MSIWYFFNCSTCAYVCVHSCNNSKISEQFINISPSTSPSCKYPSKYALTPSQLHAYSHFLSVRHLSLTTIYTLPLPLPNYQQCRCAVVAFVILVITCGNVNVAATTPTAAATAASVMQFNYATHTPSLTLACTRNDARSAIAAEDELSEGTCM